MLNVNIDWCRKNRGKQVGRGISRNVYECKASPDLVIKEEYADYTFANASEYLLYKEVKSSDTVLRQIICPVLYLSPCSKYLIMPKVKVLSPTYKIPRYIKQMFFDVKNENFGIYRNRIVCIDYAMLPSCAGFNLMTDVYIKYKKHYNRDYAENTNL